MSSDEVKKNASASSAEAEKKEDQKEKEKDSESRDKSEQIKDEKKVLSEKEKLPEEPIIKLENVTKTFGSGGLGLSEVTINVHKGEFVFIVGPTGSGKTTFFRLLIRDLLPQKGKVLVAGIDLTHLPSGKIPQYRKKIGDIAQA